MLLLLSADFFQNLLFQEIISGITSVRQTVWIQIRSDFVGLDLYPNVLQRLSADGKKVVCTLVRQRVKG